MFHVFSALLRYYLFYNKTCKVKHHREPKRKEKGRRGAIRKRKSWNAERELVFHGEQAERAQTVTAWRSTLPFRFHFAFSKGSPMSRGRVSQAVIKRNTRLVIYLFLSEAWAIHEPSAKQAIVVIQRGIRLVRVASENIRAHTLACLAR